MRRNRRHSRCRMKDLSLLHWTRHSWPAKTCALSDEAVSSHLRSHHRPASIIKYWHAVRLPGMIADRPFPSQPSPRPSERRCKQIYRQDADGVSQAWRGSAASARILASPAVQEHSTPVEMISSQGRRQSQSRLAGPWALFQIRRCPLQVVYKNHWPVQGAQAECSPFVLLFPLLQRAQGGWQVWILWTSWFCSLSVARLPCREARNSAVQSA